MSESGNTQGVPPGTTGQNAAAQGANANGNQNAAEYVSKADFDAFLKTHEEVLADNKKYREKLREGKTSGNSNSANSDSANSDSNGSDEVTTLRTQLRMSNFDRDISRAADKAGCIISDTLYKLLDIDDYADEMGNVKKADAVMEKLKKDNPNWFAAPKAPPNVNGGAGGGGADPNDMNARIRQAAHRGRV